MSSAEMVSGSLYRALREERDELIERVRQLEGSGSSDFDFAYFALSKKYGLTGTEAYLVWRMVRATRPLKYEFIDDDWPSQNEVSPNTINVFMCKIRKKLAPHGVTIKSQWGVGYFIEDAAKQALRSAVGLEHERAA